MAKIYMQLVALPNFSSLQLHNLIHFCLEAPKLSLGVSKSFAVASVFHLEQAGLADVLLLVPCNRGRVLCYEVVIGLASAQLTPIHLMSLWHSCCLGFLTEGRGGHEDACLEQHNLTPSC